jgi:DNA topoisomerase-1
LGQSFRHEQGKIDMAKSKKSLVIVESPAKAKTINKYLGPNYVVKASMGHVRDLPRSGMGVDLTKFEPSYEVIQGRGKVVTELKKLAKDANKVYLATDLDREGEAIAWHLKEVLKIPESKAARVVFNQITKSAIQEAFRNPHKIDEDKVNAQQARRILDRVVGYEISPILWRKVARGLSAGRVQSVAVRLIVERERQIEQFVPDEFWKVAGIFTTNRAELEDLVARWADFHLSAGDKERTRAERDTWLTEHHAFETELVEFAGQKIQIQSAEQAQQICEALGFEVTERKTDDAPDGKGPAKHLVSLIGRTLPKIPFVIKAIETKRTSSRPSAPFITSTLQQAASTRMGYPASRTMRIAQTLYEAGHITYMRTDSTNLSGDAIQMVRGFISDKFGKPYLPDQPNFFASRQSAQEAHEAIRPTDVAFDPQNARGELKDDEARLYKLIWDRFVACQMTPAQFDATSVLVSGSTARGEAIFKGTGRKLIFDGFMRVTGVSSEDQLLPDLNEGQNVFPVELDPEQNFTQPPPRYTEASLVKALEAEGIGRPSTYANIIQTIQDRGYVEQLDRRFYATLLGQIVTDKLVQGFPRVMDVQFTANMEGQLDAIEEQHLDWLKLLRDFYGPFHQDVEQALEKLEHAGGTPSDYTCEKCGKPLLYRISKNGFFLACSGYPDCRETKPVDARGRPTVREETEHKCPLCGKPMIRRQGRFGQFLGCSGYPECDMIQNLDKQGNIQPPKPKPFTTHLSCQKCGKPIYLRRGKRGPWLGCSGYPRCRNRVAFKSLPEDEQQKLLESLSAHEASQPVLPQVAPGNAAPTTPSKTKTVATGIDCEDCGKPMVIRDGKRGPFLGCSGYPKCRHTEEVPPEMRQQYQDASGNGRVE